MFWQPLSERVPDQSACQDNSEDERKIIRRNIDGVSVTIELGHDDGEQTIHLLKELIRELDNGWNAPHGIMLLRSRDERPGNGQTGNGSDEIAASHYSPKAQERAETG
jgi:hypothetical protein